MAERLHLDLQSGARAEMIAGALVAVGAPAAAAQDALVRVGLGRVDIVTEAVSRGGLQAIRCRLLLAGVDLGGAAAVFLQRPRGGSRRRHPTPKPRLEASSRPLVAAASVAGMQGERGLSGVVRERLRGDAARLRSAASAEPRARAPRGAPVAPGRWLDGTAARASDLVEVVRAASLPTIVKALALKSARRLVDALAAVTSSSAPILSGAHAARLLGDLVVGAALVDALQPSSITASAVGVTTTSCASSFEHEELVDGNAWPSPSPWLLEVLAGVPVVESDDRIASVDVAGAALVWSVVHRFGARGVALSMRQGCGAAAVDAAGRAVVARALLGPAPFVATRAGTREVSASVIVEARLVLSDGSELRRALVQAGAGDVEICEVELLSPLPRREQRADREVRVRVLLPAAAVDDATAALWRAGAIDVVAAWVERRSAGLQEVTVPIGRGRRKASVRVRVVTDGREILRVDPGADDVREAAARAGVSVHAIAAEAIAAWERLAARRAGRLLPTLPTVRRPR